MTAETKKIVHTMLVEEYQNKKYVYVTNIDLCRNMYKYGKTVAPTVGYIIL